MTRNPPLPDRESVNPEELDAYDAVIARQNWYRYDKLTSKLGDTGGLPGAEIQPYFANLLQSPELAHHISELGVVYRRAGEEGKSYAHADREWVDQVVGLELQQNFVPFAHLLDAVAVGVRPEAIKALREGRDDLLATEELQLTQYIRQFIHGTVTDSMYEAMRERLGERGVVELSAFIGHLLLTIRMQQAIGVPDVTAEQVDELLQSALDGTVELPDPSDRVPPRSLDDLA
jgi:hypothetical protein